MTCKRKDEAGIPGAKAAKQVSFFLFGSAMLSELASFKLPSNHGRSTCIEKIGDENQGAVLLTSARCLSETKFCASPKLRFEPP